MPFVLIGAFYPRSRRRTSSRALTVEPPAPRLQTDPPQDLRAFRADEDKRLNTYYWIDKQKGIVHIPIEQAMQEARRARASTAFPKAEP